MAKHVTIYTSNTCSQCKMVKKYLGTKNLSYEERNIDEKPEYLQESISLSGQMNVPVTVVRDDATGAQDVSIGWNPGKLAAALAA